MIADAIFCAIAGLDYYHVVVLALIARGLEAGRIPFGWTRQFVDAAARDDCIDQEDLKVAGGFGGNHGLLKCMTTPT
ncbi:MULTISPECIES: hypothetical protein [Bradyrhizobium]|uniref:Uncharacterized protein n=1 Tax=Bradyrhizobium arachidis TaxID=858423 RepID=A0AAE7NMJ8_9BRAD|nr:MULTISPECIES: hypothetical protein [Bradyrhizobium]QOG20318.1 hypothetical protein FOM02_26200 [Bradyrhizobium sp. SEMIA]QOZ68016.1 hypothetical protein WN72_18125 [Bradyrhizobium arachidis]UFW52664.1 hypothetical protein BaraCB756_17400 [Bradyrhizobium arachidis]SFV10080.1 hypothetical protein SAMN05192541_115156 [Bradyrhizobium arachidis]